MKRWTDKLVMGAILVAFAAGIGHYGIGFARTWRMRGTIPLGPLDPLVIVRVLDPDGRAVAGVRVCNQIAREEDGRLAYRWFGALRDDTFTDAAGMVRVPADAMIRPDESLTLRVPLYFTHPQRGLARVTSVSRRDTDRVMEVVLDRGCETRFVMSCPELERTGRRLREASFYVTSLKGQPLTVMQGQPEDRALLPPGQYQIQAFAQPYVRPALLDLEVLPGESEREVRIEMPPRRIAQLFGRAAPELEGVRAWWNSPPLRLADLRGRVVVLHFWNGVSLRFMIEELHALNALQRRYGGEGLTIVALHDGSPESSEDFATQIRDLFDTEEDGPGDARFAVALDSHELFHADEEVDAWGGVTADYGGTPQTVLIDREGRVARTLQLFDRRDCERAVAASLAGEDPGRETAAPPPRSGMFERMRGDH